MNDTVLNASPPTRELGGKIKGRVDKILHIHTLTGQGSYQGLSYTMVGDGNQRGLTGAPGSAASGLDPKKAGTRAGSPKPTRHGAF